MLLRHLAFNASACHGWDRYSDQLLSSPVIGVWITRSLGSSAVWTTLKWLPSFGGLREWRLWDDESVMFAVSTKHHRHEHSRMELAKQQDFARQRVSV